MGLGLKATILTSSGFNSGIRAVHSLGWPFVSELWEGGYPWDPRSDLGASINTPNIGNSALIIEELDWGGQDALNTCENSFFGPQLGLGRQKNVVRLGQTPYVEPPY